VTSKNATHFTKVSLLAAVARNGVIGRGGALPWHLPEDLKRFKQLTLGRPVIMGRKTYDSIINSLGKPLPGRDNIVVSRSPSFQAPGCRTVVSIEEALAAAASTGAKEVYVIGGAEIYRLALPFATHLDMTEIEAEVDGDARFPAYDRSEWQETAREKKPGEPLDYSFVTYQRRPNLR
jgi:dihydrofolate reductase